MTQRLHADEIDIDLNLVRRLVASQLPEFASEDLRELATTGSTNRLFHLGDDLLVRLPRQPGNSSALYKEQHWVGKFKKELPVASPEIVFVGGPEFGFPEAWSVVRWLEGIHPLPGDKSPKDEQLELAKDLAGVIRAVQDQEVPADIDASLRWYRGGALIEFDRATRGAIKKCRSISNLELDLDRAEMVWQQAMTLPRAQTVSRDTWYHADLVAENLLIESGRLSAVLDWGVMGVGDPTVDLHGTWELFDDDARDVFRTELGVSDEDWQCGKAWALGIALGCFAYYWDTMPNRCSDRLVMAHALL